MEVIPFIYKDNDDLIANTYIVIDSNNSCVVIDPSCDYDGIVKYITHRQLDCKGVLVTHTHFDHMRGIDRLVKTFNIPVYVEYNDVIGLKDQQYNCAQFCHTNVLVEAEPTIINDKDVIRIINEDIHVIHTPFHSKGSSCFYLKESKLLFTGDTLFRGVIGRTDLPSSCKKEMRNSLLKLMELPDEVKIYPGHGLQSTIGRERELNPFIK